jgi:hypothetical protein
MVPAEPIPVRRSVLILAYFLAVVFPYVGLILGVYLLLLKKQIIHGVLTFIISFAMMRLLGNFWPVIFKYIWGAFIGHMHA